MPTLLPDTATPAGPFPSHIDTNGKGGYRAVANAAARDAIPAYLRSAGMEILNLETGQRQRLGVDLTTWIDVSVTGPPGANGGTFSDAPSDGTTYGRKDGAWVEVGSGGGGGTWSHPTGNPVTLANGAEVPITHPPVSDHELLISIWEEVTIGGSGSNIAPTNMTGAGSPSPYLASDDGHYDPAWHLFDGNSVSEYNVYGQGFPGTPRWAKIDLGSGNAKSLDSYSIMTHYTNGAFSEWYLQGSNDDSAWTDLDYQVGKTSWTVDVPQTFTLSAASAAYRHFRLYGLNGPTNANMTELKLFEAISSSTTTELCTVGSYGSPMQFGVKRIDATTTKVKNLSGSSKTVSIGVRT